MSTIAERVAAGAALLDRHLPGWWETLDISNANFDMSDGCKCVIGQLYPTAEDYDEGTSWNSPFDIAMNSAWIDLDWNVAVSHGFFAETQVGQGCMDEYMDEYDVLRAEWERVITERRAAA